ncbi:RNA-directed DNA polymerase, eukaryota [Tanacetum coccineum]
MENVSHMDVKFMWGNSNYDFVYSDSLGSSGGILCIWEETFFRKEHVTISDYFVAIYGSWIPNKTKILLVAIYAPQDPKYRRFLWDYILILLSRWNGEVIQMGDFNEVRRVSDSMLLRRNDLKCQLHDIKSMEAMDLMQKSKVKWAVEGDENSKFFHGIINKKRSQLSVRGVFVDGVWLTDPVLVKKAFHDHFESRFRKPNSARFKINFPFPNRLTHDQVADLERGVSREEIRRAVWDCGENKSPGPDGFTFEFFRKYWNCIGPDFCVAVEHFFVNGSFSKGCNSSFVALIPKVTDAKFVNDYRPISLIGSVYKVVTKIMATRLAMVIESIVSDTQSAFVAKRQILDGPFILNEVLHWCKRKNKKVMFFKVDFAKAYDSVRWDFLIDVLEAFGFGSTWCNWVRGTFCYAKGSILVNGSPSNEFQFHRGLKQEP